MEKKGVKKIKNIDIKIIAICIAVVVAIFLVIAIIDGIYASKFGEYSKYMDEFGLSKLYSNGNSNVGDKLTKIEALKIAVSSIAKIQDITEYKEKYDGYEDETWVKYAEDLYFIDKDEINKSNYRRNATYGELVSYFARALELYTDINLNEKYENVVKDEKNVSDKVKNAFSNFVASGIITKETKNIDTNRVAIKGQANEIITNLYNVLSVASTSQEKIKSENLPTNSNSDPYVFEKYDNKEYEYSMIEKENFKTPRQVYSELKFDYSIIKILSETYTKALFNFDFEKTKLDTLKSYVEECSGKSASTDILEKYYKYLVKNKVKMSSKTELVEPCIYFDGEKYRARVKVDLEIISSNTKENLLYGDLESETANVYNDKKYSLYIDLPFSKNSNGAITINEKESIKSMLINSQELNINK